MTLLIIRHGQSEADILEVMEGRADFNLTDLGVKQAQLMSRWVVQNYKMQPLTTRQINGIAKYPTVKDFLSSPENTWDRFEEVNKAGKLPKMYFCIGTNDFLWDMSIQNVIEYFGLKKNDAGNAF